MRIDVFTIFPDVMRPYLDSSILGRARQAGLLAVHLHDLRQYAHDRHRTTDDVPYGGGGGMVMKPEPLFESVESVLGEDLPETPRILLSPQGPLLTHERAAALAERPRFALICGRYEGVDERVRRHLATEEISVGDYVLTGGELPALVVIDCVARLLPGALGDETGAGRDSFADGLLEHPHYTRPADYRGWQVPEVLLSGDHARVAAWRRRESLRRTQARRPDLLPRARLTEEDLATLRELEEEAGGKLPAAALRQAGARQAQGLHQGPSGGGGEPQEQDSGNG
ncbi:MAG: tRNA (guanosine(37)-N1)-methyltransferase TrmD [Anaerolineales bacterium]